MDDKWLQIVKLDLSCVKERFARKTSFFRSFFCDFDSLEQEYRQFLYLIALNPEEFIVPWSQKLDDFWHEHILDTRKYEADCLALFGRHIHHNPNSPAHSEDQKKAAAKTKTLYREAFKPAEGTVYSKGDAGGDIIFMPVVFCGSSSDSGSSHGDSAGSCGTSSASSCSSSSCSSCGGGGD